MTVLPFILRVHDEYGPWRRLGSVWQAQVGLPHREVRETRLPGIQKPILAISAMIWRWRRLSYWLGMPRC